MNGWTAVLLVADVVTTGIAVATVVRAPSPDGGEMRRISLGAIALAASLVALVALRASALGSYGVVMLTGAAVLAGLALRMAVVFNRTSGEGVPRLRAVGVTAFYIIVIVGAVVASIVEAPPPTPAQRDTARFGVKVFDHENRVPTQVLTHPPSLADADVPGGIAVPVDRFRFDDNLLTLVVAHDVSCLPAKVLLGPDDGRLDIIVVYTPSAVTYTASPTGTRSGVCEPTSSGILTVRTAIEVVLPLDLARAAVRDVGADGPAVEVSATPR